MRAPGVQYQVNEGGLVALLPDGRVEFCHPAIRPLLDATRAGVLDPQEIDYDEYVLRSPLVRLDGFHLAAPAIAFVETTNLCNLRCKHCYAFSGPKRPTELPTARLLRLLDELDELGVLQVFLTGGEVFTHPDAVELVTHARTKRFSTQIFTNGLLLSEERIAALPPGCSFFISFDTAEPERTIRGGMDFPRLRRTFELLRAHDHIFRTAVSVHRGNVDDVEEIFEWCAHHGYPRPQWLETHPIGRALMHKEMLLRPEDVDRVFAVYQRCMDRFHTPSAPADGGAEAWGGEAQPRIRALQTIKFCQRLERATGREKCGRAIAYVDASGTVYPCSNCMSNGAYAAGNIADRPFADVWQDGFDEIRSFTFDDHADCRTCPVAADDIWCQFRCPPLATNVSGDPHGCGATDYLQAFMLRSNAYWQARRATGQRLHLIAPQSA